MSTHIQQLKTVKLLLATTAMRLQNPAIQADKNRVNILCEIIFHRVLDLERIIKEMEETQTDIEEKICPLPFDPDPLPF